MSPISLFSMKAKSKLKPANGRRYAAIIFSNWITWPYWYLCLFLIVVALFLGFSLDAACGMRLASSSFEFIIIIIVLYSTPTHCFDHGPGCWLDIWINVRTQVLPDPGRIENVSRCGIVTDILVKMSLDIQFIALPAWTLLILIRVVFGKWDILETLCSFSDY